MIACISVLVAALNVWLQMGLCVLVLLSFYGHFLQYKKHHYCFCLQYTDEFAWQLVEADKPVDISLLKSSVVTSKLIILHIEVQQQFRALLIFSDAVDVESYRKLQVYPKIKPLTKQSSDL